MDFVLYIVLFILIDTASWSENGK